MGKIGENPGVAASINPSEVNLNVTNIMLVKYGIF